MSRIWNLLRKAEDRARAADEFESTLGFSTGRIPVETVELRAEHRIVAYTEPRGPAADRLRFLRLRLNQVWNTETLKRLLVTSPLPHDGKSTIALNLAVTLGEEGKRKVLLIEGDLHRATLSAMLGMSGRPGLAECLESGADAGLLVRRIEPLGCYFLPAGKAEGNPSELLHSGDLRKVMEALSGSFDWVIVDSPPVIPLTDALSWKGCTDATLLLARAGRTPASAVEQAVQLLGKKNVLAIILNGVDGLDAMYRKYYRSYSRPAAPASNGLSIRP
jgi:capsular exopolysaccharide synthesis family protein